MQFSKDIGKEVSFLRGDFEKFQSHAFLKVSEIVMKKQDQGPSVPGAPNSSAGAFFTASHFLHAVSPDS